MFSSVLLVLGLSLVLTDKAEAFIPSGSFGFVAGPFACSGSWWHTTITEFAFKQCLASHLNRQKDRPPGSQMIATDPSVQRGMTTVQMYRLYYGKKFSSFMLMNGGQTGSDFAASAMLSSVESVDLPSFTSKRHKDPRYHFDAEHFYPANDVILEQRKQLLAAIAKNEFLEARVTLGAILHTVQDFYSHSNYLEMGKDKPYPNLGTKDAKFSVAGPQEVTCTECRIEGDETPECHDNVKNIGSKLTSGYYGGQTVDGAPVMKPVIDGVPAGEGKCNHGGNGDKTRQTPAAGGIAKDAVCKKYAPHNYLHLQAAELAVQASVQFIEGLLREEVVNNNNYGELLGLQGSSLAVAIDTTGSMERYIEVAKERVIEMVHHAVQSTSFISNYVLAPFNDPSYGPVFVTEDPDVFIRKIGSLTASGGGDTPEMGLSGVIEACQAANYGSQVFVFTDAGAKDTDKFGSAKEICGNKKIQVTAFGVNPAGWKTGGNQPVTAPEKWAGDKNSVQKSSETIDVWFRIASETGGLVFTKDDDSLLNMTSYMDTATNGGTVNIAIISVATKPDQSSFLVDSTLTSLSLTISSTSQNIPNSVGLIDPDGKPAVCTVETDASTVRICTVSTSLKSGKWSLSVSESLSADWEARITAISTTGVSCSLSTLDENSGYSIPIVGNPSAGSKVYLKCTASDKSATLKQVSLLDKNKNPVRSYDVLATEDQSNTIYYFEIDAPDQPFYLCTLGQVGNTNFQRLNIAQVTPTSIKLEANGMGNDTFLLKPGEHLTLKTNVTNLGSTTQFIFAAADTLNLLIAVQPGYGYLSANESIVITTDIQVPPVSPQLVGRTSVVTLTAQQNGDLTKYNYMSFTVRIVSAIDDNVPPKCKVIWTNVDSCRSVSKRECFKGLFNASFTAIDDETGLSYVGGNQEGLGFANWTLPDQQLLDSLKPGEPAMAAVVGDCCSDYVELVALDRAGQTAVCRVEIQSGASKAGIAVILVLFAMPWW